MRYSTTGHDTTHGKRCGLKRRLSRFRSLVCASLPCCRLSCSSFYPFRGQPRDAAPRKRNVWTDERITKREREKEGASGRERVNARAERKGPDARGVKKWRRTHTIPSYNTHDFNATDARSLRNSSLDKRARGLHGRARSMAPVARIPLRRCYHESLIVRQDKQI